MLPTIAYLTLLDYYVLSCSVIMGLVTLQTSITSAHFAKWAFGYEWSESALDDLDRIMLWAIFGLWGVIQVLFIAVFCWASRERRKREQTKHTDLVGKTIVQARGYRVAPTYGKGYN